MDGMSTTLAPAQPAGEASLQPVLAPYAQPDSRRSVLQIATSFVPFALLWYLMYRSLELSYWLTLALAVPAAGFLVRIFIIQHDCGHASFFQSIRLANAIGRVCGVLTLTPYRYWARFHAIHHATSSKLHDRPDVDFPTLTVREYLALSRWGRLRYRIWRNPLVLFGLGAPIHFLVRLRLPWIAPRSWKRERRSILGTNLAIAGLYGGLALLIGWRAVLLVELPIMLVASWVGLWLFYVQHQFEDTYWEGREGWSFVEAGLAGSSYYRLPPVLRWFTGSVGLHHIHHLATRIPNYRLQQCLVENPVLQQVPALTFWKSLRCASLKLWDEHRRRLVRFRDVPAS
jgi:omega-6 fatty acid desaturase (delta-12 desaturase)